MRCVYWSADFSEARVVEAMFRAQGVPVFVFDAGMAQLDWFKSLAIGGYRIMVPESQLDAARRLLAEYRAEALAPAAKDIDVPPCPRCGSRNVNDDPRPRRRVFGAVIASQAAPLALMLSLYGWWLAGLASLLPLIVARWLGSRHRCADCAYAFAMPRMRFDTLARSVSEAEAAFRKDPA